MRAPMQETGDIRIHVDGQMAIAWAITMLFLGLGIVYSVVTPLFESTDEITHYPYIRHLATGHGLPVQRPGVHTLWEQEGSQPPLYYALSALMTFWIDTHDLEELRYFNPHARIGVPNERDNKNMIVHTAREAYPWRGTALAMHLVRLLSVLMGAGTIWCTYSIAQTVLPGRPAIALGAMAANAFIPTFIFVSASVNNDGLVTLCSSLALLMIVRLVRHGTSERGVVLLGAVIGLACLSKLSGLGLIPLAVLALALWHLFSGRASGKTCTSHPPMYRILGLWARDFALMLLPVLLVAGWWYLRNWRLYGDPTGLSAMLAFTGRRTQVPSLSDFIGEFRGLRMSFWGMFGVFNVLLRPVRVYTLLDGITALIILGLGVRAYSHARRRDVQGWPMAFVLAAWVAIEAVALLNWTALTNASQGRLLFPAISAICLFAIMGWTAWLPRRLEGALVVTLSMFLVALAASAPLLSIRPAYLRPPILTEHDIPPSATRIQVTYGEAMRLMAYDVDRHIARPGDHVAVALYWQALAQMSEDYSIYLQLVPWQGTVLAQKDTYPGGGSYPTRLWTPGEVMCDLYYLRVFDDAGRFGPLLADLEAGLYRQSDMRRIPARDERGAPVGRPVLARIKIDAPSLTYSPTHELAVDLGGYARLVGYDAPSQVTPGEQMTVTLYWRALRPMERDLTVFIHIANDADQVVAQGDGPPMWDAYPTSHWKPGDVVRDSHRIVMPLHAHAGNYRVWAGLYDPATGERLPVLNLASASVDNRVLLAGLRVAATTSR